MTQSNIHCKYDVLLDPKELKPHPKNMNKHGQDQIERLALLFKSHGIRHPVIVSKRSGYIVAGHGRIMAALRAGIKEYPIVYQSFDSDESEYAFLVSDNAIALWAELDLAQIHIDLQDMEPFDLNDLGIQNFKLEPDPKEGLTDEDQIPEQADSVCKLGDIWQLGDHRLMCGSSTNKDQVYKLINKQKIELTFTSPPYNAAAAPGGSGTHKKYLNSDLDNKSDEDYADFLSDFMKIAIEISNVQFINLQLLQGGKRGIIEWLYRFKDNYLDQIIWNKTRSTPGPRSTISLSHEHVFIFSNEYKPNKHIKNVDFDFFQSVITIDKNKENEHSKVHSAAYPVDLCEKLFKIAVSPNGYVYEPFGGTGTTLIACEKTNRKCFMMELEPHYCDVIIKRWENYTGQKAIKIDS